MKIDEIDSQVDLHHPFTTLTSLLGIWQGKLMGVSLTFSTPMK